MGYNLIPKSNYSATLVGFNAKINQKSIRLGTGFCSVFNDKSHVLVYLDKENKKLAIKPTEHHAEAYKVKVEDKGVNVQAQKLLKQVKPERIVFIYNSDINGVGEGYEADITLKW